MKFNFSKQKKDAKSGVEAHKDEEELKQMLNERKRSEINSV